MQDMLENKIASLVETLKYADSAEKRFLMKKEDSPNKPSHSLSRDDAVLKALNSISENLKTGRDDQVCIEFLFF